MNAAKLHPGLADLVVTHYIGGRDQAGRFEGHGSAQFIGGHVFTGHFKDGMMEGDGVYRWSDGTLFTGEFRRNSISGLGTYEWPDGTVYVGSVLGGLRHGQGILKGKDGFPLYDGQWYMGRRHGYGILSYNSEQTSRYEGSWKDDHREGKGTMHYPSGNVYSGEWSKGIKCGVGTMLWHDRGERYIGSWLNDQQNGRGEHVWMDCQPEQQWLGTQRHMCNRFHGEWENGVRHGVGTFYYANGARYNGEWCRGIKQGKGLFIHDDGTLYAGKFLHDHAQRDVSLQVVQDATRIQPSLQLHIGDILGAIPNLAAELTRLQKTILRANSELKSIYQAHVTNDIEKGIFAVPFYQLHKICSNCAICPATLSPSKINSILLAMRRQHATVTEVEVLRHNAQSQGHRGAIQPGYASSMCSVPCYDTVRSEMDMESEPLLYREFVEVIVRIAVAISSRHSPELTPSAAFQEIMANHIRRILPLSVEKPIEGSEMVPRWPSKHASISFQQALFVAYHLLADNKKAGSESEHADRMSMAYSSLCTLAEWPLSSDTSSLLLLANGEFIKSELQTLFEGKSESSLSTIVDVALGNLKSETCISDTRFTVRKVPLASVHRYLVAK